MFHHVIVGGVEQARYRTAADAETFADAVVRPGVQVEIRHGDNVRPWPYRRINETEGGYEVGKAGGFTTTDRVLAEAVRDEFDRQDQEPDTDGDTIATVATPAAPLGYAVNRPNNP
ncbi:hypothetical protein [Amycolatopsis thermophila]|uniref:Uncharacterized protein n=1 Tax=Amycolatopsis thermophila TaxID=206084 RepID=A0ABU0EMV0_9PSEU|nr:hypothetical protein [Amycolatopsis thermophila]MDQ0376605.1 hypothetical protein [Amycolatopsis thermophila]